MGTCPLIFLFPSDVNIFLWCGRPAKIHKKIQKADIKYGGLKNQNLPLFISYIKLSWAKRILKSDSKWIIFPTGMNLEKALQYGPDYLKRTKETTSNPFCLDVGEILQKV